MRENPNHEIDMELEIRIGIEILVIVHHKEKGMCQKRNLDTSPLIYKVGSINRKKTSLHSEVFSII